jgi:hypothetical protein
VHSRKSNSSNISNLDGISVLSWRVSSAQLLNVEGRGVGRSVVAK